jgi:hypothetical protein
MQMNLAFLNPPEPQANPAPSAASTLPPNPWDQLDEASRNAALDILARLIARMLAAKAMTEATDE